jgi:hypothetical protein
VNKVLLVQKAKFQALDNVNVLCVIYSDVWIGSIEMFGPKYAAKYIPLQTNRIECDH